MQRGFNRCRVLVVLLALFVCLPGGSPVQAQQQADPAYEASVRLLRNAVTPNPNNRHAVLMRGLRHLQDPAMRPLFQNLIASRHASMQVFGVMGLGQLSDTGTINVARVAEIESPAYAAAAITAAIDDKMIDADSLADVLTWKDLPMIARLIGAMRLVELGGRVDPALFRPVLDQDPATPNLPRAELIEYAYAAALLHELKDPAGTAALTKLLAVQSKHMEYVLSNLLSIAMRNKVRSMGPIALAIAKDESYGQVLRTHAISASLRLKTKGSITYWRTWFKAEESSAQRIRLSILLLDIAPLLKPIAFDGLTSAPAPFLQKIGTLGKAVSAGDDPAQRKAVTALLDVGVAPMTRWVVSYCNREKPANGAALLALVAQSYSVGIEKKNLQLVQQASDAVMALCEHYPKQAAKLIPAMLNSPAKDDTYKDARLSVVLDGISRIRGADLTAIVKQIKTNAQTTPFNRNMHLIQRAKHGLPLTDEQWDQAALCIQGVGQITDEYRIKLAWLYLKHRGLTKRAVADALR